MVIDAVVYSCVGRCVIPPLCAQSAVDLFGRPIGFEQVQDAGADKVGKPTFAFESPPKAFLIRRLGVVVCRHWRSSRFPV